MSKQYKPEIGQAFFGNKWNEYTCPEYVEALIDYLLREIDRVYHNGHQKWREDSPGELKWGKLETKSYYWGEDENESNKPNFKHGETEIRWYKHPGRGMSVNVDWKPTQWVNWFNKVMLTISERELHTSDFRTMKQCKTCLLVHNRTAKKCRDCGGTNWHWWGD